MDIKKQLIEEIRKIDDKIILEQLTALIKEADQNISVEFSKQQIESIEKSQQQIKDGNFHNHDDVMKMIQDD